MENRIKKVLSVLSVLGILSMSSRTAYAAENDDPELYELAYSLGADKDYLGVPNYSHDDEGRPFNNDCYVDFLHHCSLLEAAYAPQETYRSVISSGSCMGISILEVLAHNGVIKPSDIQEGAETLSEITYNESSDRYITDYQSLQAYTLLDSYEKYLLTSMTYEDQIDRLIETAERCMNDDKYFLITFRNQSRAHAICGIGIKDGNWTFNDTSYDKCILTLDSNERDKDNNNVSGGFNNQRCIYINSETKQSYIPTYNVSSDDDPYVRFCAICDDTILNYKGFINPSEKTDTDLSKLKHFLCDNGTEIQKIDVYAVSEDGSSSLLPKPMMGDLTGQHLFFESDSVHVEVKNRKRSIDLRYINGDRWIDIETFQDGKIDGDFDFSDKGLSINNKSSDAIVATYQIRMNRDSFNFEPVFWWFMYSNITDDLTVEICDEGMLFKSNGRIDATVAPYYYTLDENGFFKSVTMSVDSENSPHILYSDNNVLVKADADHNITFFIDDNNDDIYDMTAIEYIRNGMKRVRKKESSFIIASQNINDFLIPEVKEFTKPLFSIPTHTFFFNVGNCSAAEFMDTVQLLKPEYDLIAHPERGTCLYRCGNERYLLQVHAPSYKEALFGKAGGR